MALHLEIVASILSAFPQIRRVLGPHGTPLIEHARAGGARDVVGLIENAESRQSVAHFERT